jgi:uncharacterized protein (DUF427 family)
MNNQRIEPGPGQESVWDYPRPPRVEETARQVKIVFNGEVIADTRRAKRVLETSHPPVYYIPPGDIRMEYLIKMSRLTWCEWKGQASYWGLSVGGRQVKDAAWFYPDPAPGYEAIKGHVAFYPGRIDACYVDGEQVESTAAGSRMTS